MVLTNLFTLFFTITSTFSFFLLLYTSSPHLQLTFIFAALSSCSSISRYSLAPLLFLSLISSFLILLFLFLSFLLFLSPPFSFSLLLSLSFFSPSFFSFFFSPFFSFFSSFLLFPFLLFSFFFFLPPFFSLSFPSLFFLLPLLFFPSLSSLSLFLLPSPFLSLPLLSSPFFPPPFPSLSLLSPLSPPLSPPLSLSSLLLFLLLPAPLSSAGSVLSSRPLLTIVRPLFFSSPSPSPFFFSFSLFLFSDHRHRARQLLLLLAASSVFPFRCYARTPHPGLLRSCRLSSLDVFYRSFQLFFLLFFSFLPSPAPLQPSALSLLPLLPRRSASPLFSRLSLSVSFLLSSLFFPAASLSALSPLLPSLFSSPSPSSPPH